MCLPPGALPCLLLADRGPCLSVAQVFLQSLRHRVEAMRARRADLSWWMGRRQLPAGIRARVDEYERHRWAATRGIDEEAMIHDLPQGLRRDVKRHLCLDLVKKVRRVPD